MSLQALADFTTVSKYSKYLPEKQRRETWEEIVNRSLNMHLNKFSYLDDYDKNAVIKAFTHVQNKEVLPSARSLQFGGKAIEDKNEKIYNCSALHIYNTRCIEKAFYLLLCGVGCGFGLRQKWVEKFPKLQKNKDRTEYFLIPDSIEGWAKSIRILVDSYLEGNIFTRTHTIFDFSQIRRKGSSLSHGGVAPGPGGLIYAHKQIKKLLESCGEKLRTVDVYDILMHTADAVLSGGIRRAACLVLFDKDDTLMMSAKIGNWFIENPQRARSNNTVLLKRDACTLEDFNTILSYSKEFGEPGVAFVSSLDTTINPCGEISFLSFQDGKPTTQMCNLTTVNGNKVQTKQQFLEYVWAASLIGTLQASYTEFKFLDEADRKMTEEEALLGVSIMGYMSNPNILLDEEILEEGAKLAVETNKIWAKKIGINAATRVTCTKPDGNSSCALGSPFAGIHPAHNKRYFRRVQVNKNEKPYQYFKSINPHLCEESIHSATGTDDIINFPVEVTSEEAIFKDTLTAIEHLEIIKKVNKAWVKNGENNNTRPVSHSVSCTVLVGEDEWEQVAQYLYMNRDNFTTASLLPRSGDKIYDQPPYEAILTEEENTKWEYLNNLTKYVDYSIMIEDEDNTKFTEEVTCTGGACLL